MRRYCITRTGALRPGALAALARHGANVKWSSTVGYHATFDSIREAEVAIRQYQLTNVQIRRMDGHTFDEMTVEKTIDASTFIPGV